jgi:5-methyltetrahydrofolate corrinoid/iron sulfur protein methyltransferase
MFEIIGERINGMFLDIREAIANKDPKPIREWAIKQTEGGAFWIDLNTGPVASKEEQVEIMAWLVKTTQEAVDMPCAIDTTNFAAMEAALKVHKGKALINSATAEQAKMDIIFPMAARYGAAVVALAMNEKGVPKSADDRCALAMEILVNGDMHGLSPEDLYIDPLVLPINVAQEHGPESLEALRQIKLLSSPAPKTTIGLSNISQKSPDRPLINKTYLAMAICNGLDSAIMDANDDELVSIAATASIILNKTIYCDSYVKMFRQR